jgi:Neuraminidase (sialidase)
MRQVSQGVERVVAATGQGYFPVMVPLGPAALGAVIRGGAPHVGRAGRLDWTRSDDGGRTWSRPAVIVDSEWDDRNPSVGVMPDGAVAVAYAEASTYNAQGEFDVSAGTYTAKRVLSTDGGATWSPPEVIDTQPLRNASPYGQMAVLADGTALLSMYQYPSECAWVMRSRDDGRTWGDITMLRGHDETALLALRDGRVLAFTRAEGSQTHGLELSESRDGGRTWSDPSALLEPGQWPFSACELASATVLLSFGNRTGPFGVGAALSTDAGRTWSEPLLLAWDCDNRDCGYPSTVQVADGTIATIYYAVGTSDRPGVEQALVLRYRQEALR